jgi:hypothetical protein
MWTNPLKGDRLGIILKTLLREYNDDEQKRK